MTDTKPKRTKTIDLVTEIQAPPEEVWRAISEGEQVARWFSPEARIEPGVGGTV